MEQPHTIARMLDMIPQPAFTVKGGVVDCLNRAAASHMIAAGTPIAGMLGSGEEEYKILGSGQLYLSLSIHGQHFGASVSKFEGFDLFCLDQRSQPELDAMALAALQLRMAVSDLTSSMELLTPALSTADAPATQAQAALVNRDLHRLLRRINNMSDATEYENGAVNKENTDISAFFDEVFEKAAALLSQAGITLHYDRLHSSVCIKADRTILERAVYNLLSNAVKFSPKGSHIEAALTQHSCYLRLSILSSGIPADMPGNVYANYLRPVRLEDASHGIGLGMVIVRAAACSHGGTVLIEQLEGKGTKVTMTLAAPNRNKSTLRSPVVNIAYPEEQKPLASSDYAGGRDHALLELSDVLPAALYKTEPAN